MISFLGYVKIFEIYDLGFDKVFIIRQAYFIFCATIGIMIFDNINREDMLENINSRNIIFVFIILNIFKIFGYVDLIIFKSIIITISSFIYFNKDCKVGIVMIIASILASGTDQSSYMIGYVVIYIILLFYHSYKYNMFIL